MALLSVHGVGKRFGGLQALHDVSFSLPEGNILSIIGPNGAGKTTLFNIIAGDERPDAGEIMLARTRVTGSSPEQMAGHGVARTFQNGRVFGNLTVLENVLLGAHLRLQSARTPAVWETLRAVVQPAALRQRQQQLVDEAKEILSLFGDRLLPRLHEPTYTLSYANRRRTEIARALALQPRLLLLDEPTAGMNPSETDEMQELIRQLPSRGLTVLLIEHKLDLVMALSDHVVALAAGQVLVAGAPAAVRADASLVEAYIGHRQPLVS